MRNGELNELQARYYQPTRPTEELYDLENDPFEINNLAKHPKYKSQLKKMRWALYKWMSEIDDPALIPEPILEDLGKKYGNKYTAMNQPEFSGIQESLIQIIEAGEKGDSDYLMDEANSEDPSARYSKLSRYLIIEFVPKEDSKVKYLLSTREDIFDKYNIENFEKEFSVFYRILNKQKVSDSVRTIYLMERKAQFEEH